MKCRVVYKLDDSVSVIHAAPKSRRADETEAAWLERAFAKAMSGSLQGLPYDDVDSATLPTREHRDAWEGKQGEGISVNQAKVAQKATDKTKAAKIDKEIHRMAEQNLKERGEL